MMNAYTLSFTDIDSALPALTGGKGANLSKLSRIGNIPVPEGFCVTTRAFQEVTTGNPELVSLFGELDGCKATDRGQISALSAKIRTVIENILVPPAIVSAIHHHLTHFPREAAFAVRSSATAEDLPVASFAGQQDTFLNIIGQESVFLHIRKCWASLYTDRAVIYRLQQGFPHQEVLLAVVVQKMVFPQAAGIMFTADPVSGNRKVSSIDAGFGLGEAMVSGLVSADNYRVQEGRISDKKVAVKQQAVHALKDGGTEVRENAPDLQRRQVLTDAQIIWLAEMGMEIAAYFGSPQDIEWCLADDVFYIVQSRPITTLFPIPEADDDANHVYVSVGHQQMMTDAMKPLGISILMLGARAHMRTAGGRLFVDVTAMLTAPASRQAVLDTLGKSDPLIKDALTTIMHRGDFLHLPPVQENATEAVAPKGIQALGFNTQFDNDPAIVEELMQRSQAAITAVREALPLLSGPEAFDCIAEDCRQLRELNFDARSMGVIVAAMEASAWINENLLTWLGKKNAADILTQSVPHNVTAEMGLALLDVADVIRPFPDVISILQHPLSDGFLDELKHVEGGPAARGAILAFLDTYGMRCTGEIDITRPRWSEKPATLVPLILTNIRQFAPGESRRMFERGREEAMQQEAAVLARLRQLPDGEAKATETKRMIGLIRNYSGYREYPKYGIVCRYMLYKQALLKEAEALARAGVIAHETDVYYLTFEEFREAVRTQTIGHSIIRQRKEAHRVFEKLSPPRVLTSDGEGLSGAYHREHLPTGAMAGLPVSSGVVEGRARVILRMEEARLEEGDILVTAFTDPSWTPLFVSIKGLVTEVGGLMTHGAVIAREYGLPAVVGVENATRKIRDGQRIRVNGTEGYIEIISI